MVNIINFANKNVKKEKKQINERNIVEFLPKLKILKGETIVIHINSKVIDNYELLNNLMKEIVTLKCMQCIVVIIADANIEISKYFTEITGIEEPFSTENFLETYNQDDVFNVISKRNSGDKISNIANNYDCLNINLSGNDLNIIFPADLIKNNISFFNKESKNLYNRENRNRRKNYSIDILEELIKTDILPIVGQSVSDNEGSKYICESAFFGAYIAKYLSALKYVMVYSYNENIPTNCIYGIERFLKIIKTEKFNNEALTMFNAGIEAIRNDVQCVHIIDTEKINLLEELCSTNFNGLFLYDDTLNQL